MGEVNVWGRRMVIADCDDFTKEYYRVRYGTLFYCFELNDTPEATFKLVKRLNLIFSFAVAHVCSTVMWTLGGSKSKHHQEMF